MESRIKCLVFWVMIWGLGLGADAAQAQTAAEFLHQKKTQEEYLLKQLAYLELYGSELRKGYTLVQSGLGTIKGFTSGEFKLHEAFFDALCTVSSVVRNDFRVKEIAVMQFRVRSSLGGLSGNPASSAATESYIDEVRKTIIEECDKDLDELLDIVLSGEVKMNDQQRLARVKAVHDSMVRKASFTAYFCAEVNGLLMNRKQYQVDLKQIRRFYEKH